MILPLWSLQLQLCLLTSLPRIPCCSASRSACCMAASTSRPSAAASWGMGTATSMPLPRPSRRTEDSMAAALRKTPWTQAGVR